MKILLLVLTVLFFSNQAWAQQNNRLIKVEPYDPHNLSDYNARTAIQKNIPSKSDYAGQIETYDVSNQNFKYEPVTKIKPYDFEGTLNQIRNLTGNGNFSSPSTSMTTDTQGISVNE